jgi:hypothetical protein
VARFSGTRGLLRTAGGSATPTTIAYALPTQPSLIGIIGLSIVVPLSAVALCIYLGLYWRDKQQQRERTAGAFSEQQQQQRPVRLVSNSSKSATNWDSRFLSHFAPSLTRYV